MKLSIILLLVCLASIRSENKRNVRVYTPYPDPRTVEWLKDARSSITGVYTCCGGYKVSEDGTFVARSPMNLTALRDLGLDVIPLMGIDQKAVESGAGIKAASQIAEVAFQQKLDGFVCDYEPSTNYTMEHVEAYAAFLKATADAMHEKNLKFGLDIAGWGILRHTDIYAKTGVDIMTSMTPTYYGKNLAHMVENREYVRTTLKNALTKGQVEIGFGTMLVDESKAKWNYEWTEEEFVPFVKWCAEKGVQSFALWRADIDNLQPANGTENYYFKAMHEFLHP